MELGTLASRAAVRPSVEEPLDATRLRGFWAMARIVATLAFFIDIGLWLGLRTDPRIAARTLDTFAAINLPVLALLYLLGRRHAGREVGRGVIVLAIVLAQLSVVVWIQVTGTLSSYFLVAGAMLVAGHRALLSWSMGVVSLAVLLVLHGGAFGLEEAGVLDRVPLFNAAPGPVYEAASIRVAVILSIASVYTMTWMGSNLLVTALRRTERALAVAERRLVAVTEGAREGRLTGQVVSGFLLGDVIGRGGMAEVYRGARAGQPDGARVAVKVVHPHLVDDEHLLARVRREAKLAARLPASVTATVREVHLAGPGERVVVFDHLDGEDLAARLRRQRRLPVGEVVPLMMTVCRAVIAIHQAGIVHRDLKPHNLFLLDDGTVRVLDFGVASSKDDHDELTQTAAVLGTPGYIAPEMVESGAADIGPEADVYALGVVAFQLLTGERPAAEKPTERRTSGETPRPSQFNPDVRPALDAVITLAMARSPTRRYRTVEELAIDLARAIDGTLPPEVLRKADPATGGSLEDTFVARPPPSVA